MTYAQTSIERDLLERRRSLLRDMIKESRQMAALLEERGDVDDLDRLRRVTWDAQLELVEVEAELARLKD